MDPIIKNLKDFKNELEKNSQGKEKILDISYYGKISLSKNDLDMKNAIKEDLYLIKKEIDGKINFEFCTDYGMVAKVLDNGQIEICGEYKEYINEKEFLIQLEKTMPLSLKKLEELEMKKNIDKDKMIERNEREENITEKENDKDIDKEKQLYEPNANDVEIDLSKKITETKDFSDLVPEVKQKGIQKVVARRATNSQFELIGINSDGEIVNLETLEQTEGTNPSKEIIEVNGDGSKVQKDQVMTMLKIKNGENQGRQDEGFTIDIGDYGVPKVNYYRRASQTNEYTSIPVNLKNTNQKITDREVREYIEKKRNISVEDNIVRAEDRIDYNESNGTELENIDDDLSNDKVVDESEILIRKAAARCKMDVEDFKKELENASGDSLEEKIENTEEEINKQFRGNNRRA